MIFESNDTVMGRNIYYLRNRNRISRKTLSQKVGLNLNTLYCLEKGFTRYIPTNSLMRICELFHISAEDLIAVDLCSQ